MAKICKECGFAPAEVEKPVPPKGAAEVTMIDEEPKKCPNCGKEGTMEEVPDVPTGEEEEE